MDSPSTSSPFLGHPGSPSLPGEIGAWTVELGVDAFPFLADHRLRGAVILPGAAMVEIALAAATAGTGLQPRGLDEVRFDQVCVLPSSGVRRLHVALRAGPDTEPTLTVSGARPTAVGGVRGTPATPYATAKVTSCTGASGGPFDAAACASQVRRAGVELRGEAFYDGLEAVGNNYGPTFRGIRRLWRRADEAVAVVHAGSAICVNRSGWLAHPVVVDAAVQLVATATGAVDQAFVWAGCERVRLVERLPVDSQVYARARRSLDADTRVGDVFVLGSTGQVVAEITGVRIHLLRAGTTRRPGGQTATVPGATPTSRRDDDGQVLIDGE